jgi:uncharacterized protein YecT (DUF1311 family)
MILPTRIPAFGLLASVLATLWLGASARGDAGPYHYHLEVTSEEGQRDPAITGRYTAQWQACQDKAQATPDNEACFVAEFARQDAILNKTWNVTLPRMPADQHRPLLLAERRWIAKRDPFCRKQTDAFKGGTIVPIIYLDCKVELTIRRTIWLENLP